MPPLYQIALRSSQSLLLAIVFLAVSVQSGIAAIQFDVFAGYDSIVREAAWFPVACEIHNDGPPFKAHIEITSGGFGSDQIRRIPLELPTNTRKRIVIPMFASSVRYGPQWDARLIDDNGKVRAERLGIQAKFASYDALLMGALPRTFNGMPTMPNIKPNRVELKPQAARLQIEQFPDSPIALEGLDAIYVNSEKAITLPMPQVAALIAWVRDGGHLIVGIESAGDVSSLPWLQQFLPVEISGVANVAIDEAIGGWLGGELTESRQKAPTSAFAPKFKNLQSDNPYSTLPRDTTFNSTEVPIVRVKVKDGTAIFSAGDSPLLIQANRGRGKISVLTFSPEREPFRSWKNRPYFWARLTGLAPDLLLTTDNSNYGGASTDAVFGALIDSRQVKNLPVEWLLLLLLVYLIVIGPFDQYWLKKINRQMLTWITFPAYVVIFSFLIYFIGYKLRAGETEWNELQIVDILPRGDRAELRGRTYASVYSSENSHYQLASEPMVSTLRGEFLDLYAGGGRDGNRLRVDQTGNSFQAEITVPVWTSLLYVNDWFKQESLPLIASVTLEGNATRLKLQNLTDRPLTDLRFAYAQSMYEIGNLEAGETKTILLDPTKGTPVSAFVQQNGGSFPHAVGARRNAFGDDSARHLENRPLVATVVSLGKHLAGNQSNFQRFVSPPGLDISASLDKGDAILFAFDPGHAYAKPINQFTPKRVRRDSLLRLVIPVKQL
ncbi:MAG: hypothetical protein JWM99_465 [Verrucomicrobiales bacterium]|nr:hypothetical protein [Verrucomicrobiales bacterium]